MARLQWNYTLWLVGIVVCLIFACGCSTPDGGKVNMPPDASISTDVTPGSLTVHFDGSGSRDSDGTIELFTWDFGDGTSDTGSTVDHTYSQPGTYPVKLTVTDNRGGMGTASTAVTV